MLVGNPGVIVDDVGVDVFVPFQAVCMGGKVILESIEVVVQHIGSGVFRHFSVLWLMGLSYKKKVQDSTDLLRCRMIKEGLLKSYHR